MNKKLKYTHKKCHLKIQPYITRNSTIHFYKTKVPPRILCNNNRLVSSSNIYLFKHLGIGSRNQARF